MAYYVSVPGCVQAPNVMFGVAVLHVFVVSLYCGVRLWHDNMFVFSCPALFVCFV